MVLGVRPVNEGDPRVRVFCAAGGPEVFDGIVYGTQIWSVDPFDVPSVHAEARQTFSDLLDRAARSSGSTNGRVFLLLGEAGSGKTHLLRAFRHRTHTNGGGYCGYLQLTTRADDYARYVLANLVDSLELPYEGRTGGRGPDGWTPSPTTGLGRLADAVLDAAGTIRHAQRRLLEEATAPDALAPAVYAVADEIARVPRFAGVDVDVLRVVLFLLSRDPRVRAVASKWLRCEDLSRYDREWIGDMVPRTGADMPRRQILALGRLMATVDAALVLLVDQMEGVVEVAHEDGIDPGRVLRTVVNELLSLADGLPNAVIVLACLEDLFAVGRSRIPEPTLHRLERDPEPARLGARRTLDQIAAIVGQRLAVLYSDHGVRPDPEDPIAPFTRGQLAPLVEFGGRTRDMLHHLQHHRRRCVAAGAWLDPVDPEPPAPLDPTDTRTSQRWSDFLAGWRLGVLSDARMADLLAWAAQMVPSELGAERRLDARADGRFVHLELDGERTLLAVVDDPASDDALDTSLVDGARAGNRPAVLVRSTDFPEPSGDHRQLVVQNSDWRALEALREFSELNRDAAGFTEWLRTERPLSARPAIQELLEIAIDSGREAAPEPSRAEAGPFRLGCAGERSVVVDPQELGHVALVGGPRSGRTTAALVFAESLSTRGVPVAIVERKGDLARYVDPAAWGEPVDDPVRAGRRATFLARTRPRLWTPGATDGRPLGVGPFPAEVGEEPILSLTAAALGGWMDYRTKAHEPKIALLKRAIAALAGRDQAVTVPALRALVDARDPALLEDSPRERHLENLQTDLATLWLRKRWLLEGDERVDVERMFRARPDRANLEILNLRFLEEDAEYWLAQLLIGVVAWCRRGGPATDGPRGALVLDDADQWLAPASLPAVRHALRELVAVARPAGLVVILTARAATDLDVETREWIDHWGLGRVTERLLPAAVPPPLTGRVEQLSALAPRLKPGEFVLSRPGAEPLAVEFDYNLIPARTQPAGWMLGLARDGRSRREDTRWLG